VGCVWCGNGDAWQPQQVYGVRPGEIAALIWLQQVLTVVALKVELRFL
jgi:hypothetical protein